MAISVEYKPLEEDFEEGADANGVYAYVKYLVDWDDRYTFANEMLGSSSLVGGVWQQVPPHRYSPSPNLFATQLAISGEGALCADEANVDCPRWTHAKVGVWYRTTQWNFKEDQDPFCLNSFGVTTQECEALLWAESELESTVETYSIPGTHSTYESDGSRVASPIRLIVPVRTLHIVWHRYPEIPDELDMAFEGLLNDSTFLGRATGTVQYLTMGTKRQLSADTTLAQQLRMTFRWRRYDWNMEPKLKVVDGVTASFGDWDYITAGGERRYGYGNLFNLISFNPIP